MTALGLSGFTFSACVVAAMEFLVPCESSAGTRLSFARDSVRTSDSGAVDHVRLALVLTGGAGIVTAAHIQNYSSFWKGERGPFHFGEDGKHYKGMDKFGHNYFTYVSSDAMGRSLAWSGVSKRSALCYGAMLALAFQLYVEVEDGFTPSLGFSVLDAVADIAGASYPILQDRFPALQNIRWKWSFIKSDRFKRGEFRSVIDDYESQYHWLSVNTDLFIPHEWQSAVTSFLALGIGYSVKRLDNRGGGQQEFFLMIDYDFEKLPGDGTILKSIKHILNYVHFPSPMIRVAPSFVAYGFRF